MMCLLDYIFLVGRLKGWMIFLTNTFGAMLTVFSTSDSSWTVSRFHNSSCRLQKGPVSHIHSQVAFFTLWSYITLSVITWKECRVHQLLLNLPRLARCQGAVRWSGLRQQVMFGLMLKDQVGRLISVCYWQEVRLLTEGLGRARSSSLCADRRLAPESRHTLSGDTLRRPDTDMSVFITVMIFISTLCLINSVWFNDIGKSEMTDLWILTCLTMQTCSRLFFSPASGF